MCGQAEQRHRPAGGGGGAAVGMELATVGAANIALPLLACLQGPSKKPKADVHDTVLASLGRLCTMANVSGCVGAGGGLPRCHRILLVLLAVVAALDRGAERRTIIGWQRAQRSRLPPGPQATLLRDQDLG